MQTRHIRQHAQWTDLAPTVLRAQYTGLQAALCASMCLLMDLQTADEGVPVCVCTCAQLCALR